MTSASGAGDKPGRLRAAAIVPAYNEEKTVGEVVRTLVSSGFFDEVIAISDGSTDGTAERARSAGATHVEEFPENRGKGAVMGHAVAHTAAPVVCFFDADLKGLTVEHVRMLVEPVLRGELAMHVALRDRGPFWTAVAGRLPLIGGERALRRDIFEAISDRFLHRFKVESALNYYCRVNGFPFRAIVLPGLHIVRKMQKVGFWRGLWGYVAMYAQVLWSIIEVRLTHREFVEHATHMDHRHGGTDDRKW